MVVSMGVMAAVRGMIAASMAMGRGKRLTLAAGQEFVQ
ncbi:MAG: hypothetical protein K0Q63_2860 [Paenibacillus sp.]|nr:hypothetical protein [Paenibacillus sp.]